MSVHSSQKYRKKDWTRIKLKGIGSYKCFLERIRKTLYYENLPLTERLSLPVTELAAELYSEVKSRNSVERLRLEEASEISRNACVSPCTLVLAIIYLEQLKASNASYVERVTPSDLFIVSLMIATKFLNDYGEEDDILNSEWADSVGLTLKEVNYLEKEFLAAINWQVFVTQDNFWLRLRKLERDVSLKEGSKRGWFSYTELENLLDTINGLALAQAVFTVSAVCLASYTAGLLTIIGSTLLVSQLPKYSIPSENALDFSSDILSKSTPSITSPLSLNSSDELTEECESFSSNYIKMENAYKEIIDYLKNENIKRNNLEKKKNFTVYDYSYFCLLASYIRHISNNIDYLPLKIGTEPIDTGGYFLHNSFLETSINS